jgi:predicted O-methyltransferase YrrM
MLNRQLTAYVLNNLRILKAKNPGDTYYDEYLKHSKREGVDFFDQYHCAILRVVLHKPKRILEIGVRTGLSICNMLSAYRDVKEIERIVLCDVWNDGFASPEIVKMYLKAMNLNVNPEFIVGDSKVEIPKLEGDFDYILVDGDHDKTAALIDLENVVRLVAPGGVIVFDDISPYGCNLLDVWESFKENHKGEFEFSENMKGKGTAWAEKK